MADIRREQQDDRETLFFSGELTVQHAAAVAKALREALQRAAAVEIVIERVTAADVTFPQAVCAAHRTAASLNKSITIRGEAQEPMGSLLLSAGFLRHIGCQGTTRKSCLWLAG
jgi:ABC-type transporter Mla MlaB component